MEEASAGTPLLNAKRIRSVDTLRLIGIIYFATSGGPEGTESMIRTGGPLVTIVGLVVAGVVWSLPIAIMTAELCSLVPENGGVLVWARAAWSEKGGLHELVAFLSAWACVLFFAVDAALYPKMFTSYVEAMTGYSLGPYELPLQAGFIAIVTVQNVFGVKVVGSFSDVTLVLLLLPYVVITFLAFTDITGWGCNPENWGVILPNPDYPKFLVLVLWNMGMWEGGAVCAGEVQEPRHTIPKALSIVLVLVLLNYMLPIMAFTGLDSHWELYRNGTYIDIALRKGGKALGILMTLSQCFSCLGMFSNNLLKSTFLLCGLGEQGMLPGIFCKRTGPNGMPLMSVGVSVCISMIAISVGVFDAILQLDMLLYASVMLVEIAAYITIRRRWAEEPPESDEDAFRVPVSTTVVIICLLPAIVLASGLVLIGDLLPRLIGLGLIVLGVLVAASLNAFRARGGDFRVVAPLPTMDHQSPAKSYN